MKKKASLRQAQHGLNTRNKHGSIGMVIACAILLIVFALGSFAADLVHNTLVRAELQNASDAGALAGANALVTGQTDLMATYYAGRAASYNFADGLSVDSNTSDTTVEVRLDKNIPGEIGACQVRSSRRIQNWLSSIFGRSTDVVDACSTAACSLSMVSASGNMVFPIAVSLDAVPSEKKVAKSALKDLKLGDVFSIFINSQQVKNGAFTSLGVKNTNANWLNQAIEQALGLSAPQPNFIPPVAIGEMIFLDNGVAGQKSLAKEPRLSALIGKNIAMPVIEGTPPFNQSRPVIGWVVMNITNVTVNQNGGEVETIEGKIVKVPIRGSKGNIAGAGNLSSLSPSSVRLIANRADFASTPL